jgi:YD repeat-containing protein
MKNLLFVFSLFISFSLSAQYTQQEIKKYKISKLSTISLQDSSATHETWYDSNGNDTAEYYGGKLYKRRTYQYNNKEQATARTTHGADGNESETAEYTYKSDGSYIVKNTDKQFGMSDYIYYDRTNKIIKTVAPDGSERMYTYDAQGRLSKVKTKSGGNGVLTDIQYMYNAKGQCIKEESKGEYKWTTAYTYNAKGLLKKGARISLRDGEEAKTTYLYQYEFRK